MADPLDPLAGIEDPGPQKTGVKPSAVDRILDAATREANKALDTGPLGFGPEARREMAEFGIFRLRGRDSAENPLSMLRAANEIIINPIVGAADLSIRALSAPIRFTTAAIGQTAVELGASPRKGKQLEGELNTLVDISLIALGSVTAVKGVTPRQIARDKRVAEVIKKADPDPLAAEGNMTMVEHATRQSMQGVDPKTVPAGTPGRAGDIRFTPPGGTANKTRVPGITNPEVSVETAGKIRDAAEDLFVTARAKDPNFRVKIDDNRLLNDQVAELIATDRLSIPEVTAILAQRGLTIDDFAGMFDVSIADSARRLQQLSALKQRLEAAGILDELSVAGQGLSSGARAWNVYKRVNNIWRGLLVSQLATAVRNGLTSTGRVGVDAMQMGLQAGLQKIFPGPQTIDFADAMAPVLNLFWRNKSTRAMAEEILSGRPLLFDRMWMSFSSDILSRSRASGIQHVDTVLDRAEHAVNTLNIFNRFQDRLIRGPVFTAELQRRMKVRGLDLEDMVGTGRIAEIPVGDIEGAVDKALRMTFADKPRSELGKAWVKALSDTPVLGQSVGAFARFMGSSLKFNIQFSPFGYLRLTSPKEWKAMAAGDFSAVAEATIGSSLLFLAHQVRGDPGLAGERWYEIRSGDQTIDARSFAPFAQYLFVADLIRRLDEDRIKQLRTTDLIRGLAGTAVRAGAGLFMVDSVINGVAGLNSLEKGGRATEAFAGNFVAGFLTPLQMVRDVLSEFDENEAIIRDSEERPFLGPSMSRIPFVSQSLPPVAVPTRTAPLRRESPIVRQLTGLVFRSAKNPVEAELDRLGFERGEYAPNTGNPQLDRLVAQNMARHVEKKIVPKITGKEPVMNGLWQDHSDARKQFFLLTMMQVARAAATAEAARTAPRIALRIRLSNIPIRERRFLEEELMKRAPNSPMLKALRELR